MLALVAAEVGRLRQMEREVRFRRILHIPFSGEIRDTGPGRSSHRAADCRAFTSTGERADQHSAPSAATDPQKITFCVNDALAAHGRRVYLIGLAVYADIPEEPSEDPPCPSGIRPCAHPRLAHQLVHLWG